jgi:hypothetical protein
VSVHSRSQHLATNDSTTITVDAYSTKVTDVLRFSACARAASLGTTQQTTHADDVRRLCVSAVTPVMYLADVLQSVRYITGVTWPAT